MSTDSEPTKCLHPPNSTDCPPLRALPTLLILATIQVILDGAWCVGVVLAVDTR